LEFLGQWKGNINSFRHQQRGLMTGANGY